MARRPAAIPGAADNPGTAEDQAIETPKDARAIALGLPNFSDKSPEFAAAWFEQNPTAPRRNVLTAGGWYVHPEVPGANNPARLKG